MQNSQQEVEAHGIKIVGLSYDSPEILKEFSEREGITFPLLSDSDSSSLKALGLMNSKADGKGKGVAFPGVVYLDTQGRIQEKFFEDTYVKRPTPGTLLSKIFPNLESSSTSVSSEFKLSATGREGVMGSQWEILVTFDLEPGSHLYAQNSKGYVPLKLKLQDNSLLSFGEPIYPSSKIMDLPALNERVPVYSGKVTVRVPVLVKSSSEVKSLTQSTKIVASGNLEYQICTTKTCLLPQLKLVNWEALIKPLDRQRVDETHQHR